MVDYNGLKVHLYIEKISNLCVYDITFQLKSFMCFIRQFKPA